MKIDQWKEGSGNIVLGHELLTAMKNHGLWAALKEEVPKGHMPPGASDSDISRALGEIAGYNQCLMDIERAGHTPPPAQDMPEVTFGADLLPKERT